MGGRASRTVLRGLARCRQRTIGHLPAAGHLGAPLLIACFCGSSVQSAGISNWSDGMLDVSIEVVSVVSETTRTSGPDAEAAAGADAADAPAEDCAVMELAAALAVGSAAELAALDAAAPAAESVWMAAAPR